MDKAQYEAFVQALIDGAEDRVQGMGRHALFRRLPADRGDGRARPGDAAARADEADGPDQRAQPVGQALRGRAAAPGQCAGHALQHGRLPDQAEACRAGAHLPHHPRPRECRVRAARRAAPQHLHQLARAARPAAAAEGRARACASPARSPAAKAMSRALRSACWPAASPRPSGSDSRSSLPPATTAFGALLAHITGGHIVSDDEPGKRSFQPMNVNFGLFPPLEAPEPQSSRKDSSGRFARQGKDAVAKRATDRRRARSPTAADWLGLPAARAEAGGSRV